VPIGSTLTGPADRSPQKSPQQKTAVPTPIDRLTQQQRQQQLQRQQSIPTIRPRQSSVGRPSLGAAPIAPVNTTEQVQPHQQQLKKKFTPMRPPLSASQHQQLEHQKRVQEQQLLAQQKMKLHERQQQQQQQLQQQQQRLQQLHLQQQRQHLQQQQGSKLPVILNNIPIQKLPTNVAE
jgi:hypothetical protein